MYIDVLFTLLLKQHRLSVPFSVFNNSLTLLVFDDKFTNSLKYRFLTALDF